ncbi:hypothetical protein BGZ83_006074 [Gryganskiella cystojenkinii]|nr:hypothetical protein BGZ83_006074 [Gryganskiella cystojenkinii]
MVTWCRGWESCRRKLSDVTAGEWRAPSPVSGPLIRQEVARSILFHLEEWKPVELFSWEANTANAGSTQLQIQRCKNLRLNACLIGTTYSVAAVSPPIPSRPRYFWTSQVEPPSPTRFTRSVLTSSVAGAVMEDKNLFCLPRTKEDMVDFLWEGGMSALLNIKLINNEYAATIKQAMRKVKKEEAKNKIFCTTTQVLAPLNLELSRPRVCSSAMGLPGFYKWLSKKGLSTTPVALADLHIQKYLQDDCAMFNLILMRCAGSSEYVNDDGTFDHILYSIADYRHNARQLDRLFQGDVNLEELSERIDDLMKAPNPIPALNRYFFTSFQPFCAAFTDTGTISSDLNERQYFRDYIVELLRGALSIYGIPYICGEFYVPAVSYRKANDTDATGRGKFADGVSESDDHQILLSESNKLHRALASKNQDDKMKLKTMLRDLFNFTVLETIKNKDRQIIERSKMGKLSDTKVIKLTKAARKPPTHTSSPPPRPKGAYQNTTEPFKAAGAAADTKQGTTVAMKQPQIAFNCPRSALAYTFFKRNTAATTGSVPQTLTSENREPLRPCDECEARDIQRRQDDLDDNIDKTAVFGSTQVTLKNGEHGGVDLCSKFCQKRVTTSAYLSIGQLLVKLTPNSRTTCLTGLLGFSGERPPSAKVVH